MHSHNVLEIVSISQNHIPKEAIKWFNMATVLNADP